ncbi:Multifunctional pyrimidine synthesis protein CAD [Puccinia graminis f. sp. tritici]|uniref:Carbamoyl phosphate synthase arginine-specific small chain n=1 Tax=Puccinia graminis f. sp. tritici TaxID=56615 RepID=A0A5B0NLP5_PUCGR|nr:Multifunctional pyrimidine synthesis protein CAD [Puccinia graminis f. sp. tritici]
MRSQLLPLRSQLKLAFFRPTCRSFATTKDNIPLKPCVDSDNCAFQEPSTDGRPASLHFKSGHVFTGRSFGAPVSTFGEAVFTTSTTSYPESMTDPSYRSQILVFTTPMIGNYGIPPNILATSPTPVPSSPDLFLESERVQCSGVVVAELADRFSHYQAMESISNWCHRFGVPGITGVDTRAITSLLRQQGSTLAKIAVGDGHQTPVTPEQYWDPSGINLVAEASTKTPYTLNPTSPISIAMLDFGAKANIARSLVKHGAAVTVLPWDTPASSIIGKYHGLFLSNGPGDPKHAVAAVETVRTVMNDAPNIPIFGICMGHQIIGLAAGLETYRMRFGNRGHNQPVLALANSGSIQAGRVFITSQNHPLAPVNPRSRSNHHVPDLITPNWKARLNRNQQATHQDPHQPSPYSLRIIILTPFILTPILTLITDQPTPANHSHSPFSVSLRTRLRLTLFCLTLIPIHLLIRSRRSSQATLPTPKTISHILQQARTTSEL